MITDAGKSELKKLFELSKNNNLLTIGTTVVTGFEWQAVDECKQKICPNLRVVKDRGKIFFNVTFDDFHKVRTLKSVDNIYIVADIRYFSKDEGNEEMNLQTLKDSLQNCSELNKCLNAWKTITEFCGKVHPTIEEYEDAVKSYKAKKDENESNKIETPTKDKKRGCDPAISCEDSVLSFRVTCERTGTHQFESGDVACEIGGALQNMYHWIVDLSSYQLEVLCKITNDEMVLSLRVTPESLHRRNIMYFGPTTLRATIAYNLLSLAKPKPGDIIVDPMCGGGSIPIEGALEFPASYVIGGDNNNQAVERSKFNFRTLRRTCNLDLIHWSVTHLPFKNSSVDAFVTDLPFGKRSGSKIDNRILYKQGLLELARVVNVKYGRLVLLTYDRRSMSGALQAAKELFKVKKMLGISMGGLNTAVYVLKRTNLNYDQFKSKLFKSVKAS